MNKKIFLPIILGIILLALAVVFFSQENNSIDSRENTFAVINGEKISLPEYKIYLLAQKTQYENIGGSEVWDISFDGQSAEEMAKIKAFDSIKLVKISAIEARKQDLELTEYDLEQVNIRINNFLKYNSKENLDIIGATDKELRNLMEDTQLYSKLYSKIVDNLTTDFNNNTTFEKYKLQQIEENPYAYYDFYCDIITFEDKNEEEATTTLVNILTNSNFEKIAKEKNAQFNVNIKDLELSEPALKEISFLNVEEISGVIKDDSDYLIVKANSITESKENSLEDSFIEKQKQELFNDEYAKLIDSSNIQISEELWETLSVHDFK